MIQVCQLLLVALYFDAAGASGTSSADNGPGHYTPNCTEVKHFVPDDKTVDIEFRKYYFPPTHTSQVRCSLVATPVLTTMPVQHYIQVGCLVFMFSLWVFSWFWLYIAETYFEEDMFGRKREVSSSGERTNTWYSLQATEKSCLAAARYRDQTALH